MREGAWRLGLLLTRLPRLLLHLLLRLLRLPHLTMIRLMRVLLRLLRLIDLTLWGATACTRMCQIHDRIMVTGEFRTTMVRAVPAQPFRMDSSCHAQHDESCSNTPTWLPAAASGGPEIAADRAPFFRMLRMSCSKQTICNQTSSYLAGEQAAAAL